MRIDEKLVEMARREDGWVLMERLGSSQSEWRNFNLRAYKLGKPRKGQRRSYWVSWNGSRFARSTDSAAAPPDLLDWVLSSISVSA